MNLFTYGSLMFPQVWESVTGRAQPCVPGTIGGFVRRRVRGATYPGILATGHVGDTVSGAIYRDVDAPALAALDAFESDFYIRGHVEAAGADGEIFACEAYIVPPANAHLLSPAEWDLDAFAANDLAEYLRGNFG